METEQRKRVQKKERLENLLDGFAKAFTLAGCVAGGFGGVYLVEYLQPLQHASDLKVAAGIIGTLVVGIAAELISNPLRKPEPPKYNNEPCRINRIYGGDSDSS
jgi:hypothetical protein